ncbi:MAG: hypothetical protein WBQ25_23775 [Nitrososphaeraceae archaeon]
MRAPTFQKLITSLRTSVVNINTGNLDKAVFILQEIQNPPPKLKEITDEPLVKEDRRASHYL